MSKTHFNRFIGENTSSRFSLPVRAGVTDNKDLSKLESGQPFRYLLAFFVLKNRVASQATDNDSIALPHFIGVNRHILGQPQFEDIPSYGEVTPQNKIAFMVNMWGGFFRAKSEPCLTLLGNVQISKTQKSKGVSND